MTTSCALLAGALLCLLAAIALQGCGTSSAPTPTPTPAPTPTPTAPPAPWDAHLDILRCEGKTDCSKEALSVVMDANWRWVHDNETTPQNCYLDNNTWSASLCPDMETCSKNCILGEVGEKDWVNNYGITNVSGGVMLKFKTKDNVGSRLYVAENQKRYKQFKLKNREISFEVDVSTLPCGMNGALYLVEMSADGGQINSKTGVKYGTGYCDAQCPKDVKYIMGKPNSEDWREGHGSHGSCCAEMDLWEANSMASVVTPHPCNISGPQVCKGTNCSTTCDSAGCDFNAYRMGAKYFFGKGSNYTLDSSKPFTVVTQFKTVNDSDDGDLIEIRRHYVQDGKTVRNPNSSLPGLQGVDTLTDQNCKRAKKAFNESTDSFTQMGGMQSMGAALDRGMVLVLSIWDDATDQMHWLDSTEGNDSAKPGAARGPCSNSSGDPANLRKESPHSYVKYSNIKYGPIGSTAPNVADAAILVV